MNVKQSVTNWTGSYVTYPVFVSVISLVAGSTIAIVGLVRAADLNSVDAKVDKIAVLAEDRNERVQKKLDNIDVKLDKLRDMIGP